MPSIEINYISKSIPRILKSALCQGHSTKGKKLASIACGKHPHTIQRAPLGERNRAIRREDEFGRQYATLHHASYQAMCCCLKFTSLCKRDELNSQHAPKVPNYILALK